MESYFCKIINVPDGGYNCQTNLIKECVIFDPNYLREWESQKGLMRADGGLLKMYLLAPGRA
jgi:hypothetical protein